MTDREEAGLRGLVKFCSSDLGYVHPDHQWVMRTYEMFSPQGDLLEQRHRNPDGSHCSTIYRYDEYGRILEREQVSSEPEGHQLFSYRYDPLGRLDRVIMPSDQEDERVLESVQYAADGTKTQTLYPPPLIDAKEVMAGVSDESRLHLSPDAVVIMTVFDAGDRPVRKVLYDRDERVIRRVAFHYDARGLLLEEGELVGGSIRDDFRNVYRYDALGRLIEADRQWVGLSSRRTFAYNDRGDIVEETIEQSSLTSEDTGSQTWMKRFTYQYDDFDNWIERRT